MSLWLLISIIIHDASQHDLSKFASITVLPYWADMPSPDQFLGVSKRTEQYAAVQASNTFASAKKIFHGSV